MGWAFKKNTNDTRESAAIYVASNLLKAGINLKIYDPKVNEMRIYNDLADLNKNKYHINQLSYLDKPDEDFSSTNIIAILTEWDEFIDYDWKKIYNQMIKPAYIFDGRNILDMKLIKSIGFRYIGLGKNG